MYYADKNDLMLISLGGRGHLSPFCPRGQGGGLQNVHACPLEGGRGSKLGKNWSTQLLNAPKAQYVRKGQINTALSSNATQVSTTYYRVKGDKKSLEDESSDCDRLTDKYQVRQSVCMNVLHSILIEVNRQIFQFTFQN